MVLGKLEQKLLSHDNGFYRQYYHYFIYGLMGAVVVMIMVMGVLLYQATHQPLPVFTARLPDNKQMLLTLFEEPNLLSDTILQWASNAATAAYTFRFDTYKVQLKSVAPYFTPDGWQDYLRSVNGMLNTLVQNQLIVYGIVSGAPVISNQGQLPDKGYVWRVQIPFLVTYESANTTTTRNFVAVLSIVRVPTNINPQGIGVDQFVMVGG
jgi:intracellular multiplication protein IcmL